MSLLSHLVPSARACDSSHAWPPGSVAEAVLSAPGWPPYGGSRRWAQSGPSAFGRLPLEPRLCIRHTIRHSDRREVYPPVAGIPSWLGHGHSLLRGPRSPAMQGEVACPCGPGKSAWAPDPGREPPRAVCPERSRRAQGDTACSVSAPNSQCIISVQPHPALARTSRQPSNDRTHLIPGRERRRVCGTPW